MSKKHFISVVAIVVAVGLGASIASAQITIPTVPIANPGNAADPTTGFGSVSYSYNIGATEVTNAQYAAFLNAKAASDPFSLYDTNMAGFFGGITRSGPPGLYTYSTIPGRANNPVIYVTFWNAARFANWLHNGQGSGDTETGAYTLTAGGISANTISRNPGWQWAVTSENEWYKAAYLQPASAGGDADDYWLYPTSSNSVPSTAQGNFNNVIGNTTAVGSYAANFSSTFDMAGNVWEWNEAIIGGSSRGLRGGAYGSAGEDLRASYRTSFEPGSQIEDVGFRVSQAVAPAQITIPTVPITNPGNAADPTTGFGSVAYTYNIGTTEVTHAQYAAFLNAKASSDPNGLYNASMAGSFGGITRAGSPGSYTYSTISGRESNPVNYVSFWDATRFANWLHNGQGNGDTESGAYTLTAGGISANTITRNTGAVWAVANENEWYKAAYYQPASAGGDSDNYWLYPTSSNTAPTIAQANMFLSGINNTRPVGSYAANYFGAFDMAGNVFEWHETIVFDSFRGLRGGAFNTTVFPMRADINSDFGDPATDVLNQVGFRVVTILPTLSTNLQLLDTVASFAAPRQITYTVIKNNVNIASGIIAQNASSINASISLPPGQTGAATVVFDGSSFLRRVVAINLTGSNQSLGLVSLTNGDADLSGEVDAADIDLVIADFGSIAVGNSDVDVSGEVDAADIDIVIASFGNVDE